MPESADPLHVYKVEPSKTSNADTLIEHVVPKFLDRVYLDKAYINKIGNPSFDVRFFAYSTLKVNLYCVLLLEAMGQTCPNAKSRTLAEFIDDRLKCLKVEDEDTLLSNSGYDEISRMLSKRFPGILKELFAIRQEKPRKPYQIQTRYPDLLFPMLRFCRSMPLADSTRTSHSFEHNSNFYKECIRSISQNGWNIDALVQYYMFERLFRLNAKTTLFEGEFDRNQKGRSVSPRLLANCLFLLPLVVTKSIKLPKYETRVQKQAYTQEQYNLAYRFAAEWKNGLSLMLLLETGISRSELLGLRWEDIDEAERSIHINQGLVVYHSADEGKEVLESSGLKNKFRQRTIPILDDTLWNRLCHAPRSITKGNTVIMTEQVIHSPEGKPYQPHNWESRVFRRFMRELHKAHPEVPELSPHELRHTRATLWIAQGMEPYMAARLLGHSDLKMLTKIYDHTSTETLRNALKSAQEASHNKEGTIL